MVILFILIAFDGGFAKRPSFAQTFHRFSIIGIIFNSRNRKMGKRISLHTLVVKPLWVRISIGPGEGNRGKWYSQKILDTWGVSSNAYSNLFYPQLRWPLPSIEVHFLVFCMYKTYCRLHRKASKLHQQ